MSEQDEPQTFVVVRKLIPASRRPIGGVEVLPSSKQKTYVSHFETADFTPVSVAETGAKDDRVRI